MAKKKSSNNISTAVTFGGGLILGILLAPQAKKIIEKAKPMLDDFLDNMSSTASKAAEKGTDIIAEAKEKLRNTEKEK